MTGRTDPLRYHQDHLALIEEMIASKDAAISTQKKNIRQLLLEGRNVVPEANAMRANAEALRRLQSDRLATLKLINEYTGQGR
jgi:formate-dependent phosphoribosylglycinamide formyltransferase (GAR transformylase)